MKRFIFRHIGGSQKGFIAAIRFRRWVISVWLGYGKPVWWKPRFIGRGVHDWGVGLGWLLLCFRVQVINVGSVGTDRHLVT